MSDIQKADVEPALHRDGVLEGRTDGADLQAFARQQRPTSDFQLHMDEEALEKNRNYLADAQNAVKVWEIEVTVLRAREKEGQSICEQIGQLAKNHPEHARDHEKAKAILVKLTASRAAKEQNLANALARAKSFQDAVTASHTPTIQRFEKVRRLLNQIAG